jgi:hypothetical protein
MGKRAPKTNRWHGLDRQRQSNRPKLPKGLPGWSARLRSLLWSWWVWAIAAVAAQTSDRPYTALSLVFVATFVYLAAPSERAPVYGLDHEFGIESDEFLSTKPRNRSRLKLIFIGPAMSGGFSPMRWQPRLVKECPSKSCLIL